MFRTIAEIPELARAKLPPVVWDHSFAGAGSETTMRRNRIAFDSLALRPRLLRGITRRDLSTTFLGHPLSFPVMLSPVGGLPHFDPRGPLIWAEVAEKLGTIAFFSMGSVPPADLFASIEHGPAIVQLYMDGDGDWLRATVHDIENAGFSALCITADAPTLPRLDREVRGGRLAREIGRSVYGIPVPGRNVQQNRPAFSWDDLSRLHDMTKLPLMVKGILTAEDAAIAVERGIEAIYVSNHGGRSIDHLPSTIEVLPEIVRAVNGRAEIVVDSSYMRGGDVVKALALGARAVLAGRMAAWAMAAEGAEGLEMFLTLLRNEIDATLAGIGARTLADLGPHCLMPTLAPPLAVWPTYDGHPLD
jgi:glycolate oxidase